VAENRVLDRSANTATGSQLDDFSAGTVSARYVRLTVTGVNGTTTKVSIQEFGVYDRYRPRPDLARGKPTSATSALAGHAAANGTDGSSAT
jgi:hypothetical protein